SETLEPIVTNPKGIRRAVWTPDPDCILSLTPPLQVYNIVTDEIIRDFQHFEGVNTVIFSPDMKYMMVEYVSGVDSHVRIYNWITGRMEAELHAANFIPVYSGFTTQEHVIVVTTKKNAGGYHNPREPKDQI